MPTPSLDPALVAPPTLRRVVAPKPAAPDPAALAAPSLRLVQAQRGSTLVPDEDLSAWLDEPEPEEGPLEPTIGALLGPFLLVRQLGHGSTAQVWEAIDRRYDAPVALKLFTRGGTQAEVDRVVAEASAMSRVTHDHVVFVREAGRIGGAGAWYLAMALYREQVEGEPEPRIARDLSHVDPRSTAEVARWGVQIGRALAAAHAAGVFHQDLKPENVLCLPASRNVRLGDFGLTTATRQGGGARDTQSWSTPGHYCAGTPVFMAPEQARGLDHVPDPMEDRDWLVGADVYGLGAVLWSLLAEEPPHPAPRSVEQAELVRITTEPVPRLDERPTRLSVPTRLARIIAKAMAPDPVDRYDSAEAMADDLQRWLDHRPLSIDSAWAPVRASLWVRRHPLKAQTAAMLGLALVSAGIVVSLNAQVAARQGELRDAEVRLGALDSQLAGTSAQLGQAQAALLGAQGQLSDAQVALGQKSTAIETLQGTYSAEKEALSSQVVAERTQRDAAEADKANTTALLGAAIDDAQAQLRRASAEALRADQATAAAQSAARARDEALAEVQAAQKARDAAVAEAQAAVRARDEAVARAKQAEARADALEEQLDDAEGAAVRIAPK